MKNGMKQIYLIIITDIFGSGIVDTTEIHIDMECE